MNEEAAERIVAAIQLFVDDVAQLERQIIIRELEGFITDYRLRQPNYQDASNKVKLSRENLVKALVEVPQ